MDDVGPWPYASFGDVRFGDNLEIRTLEGRAIDRNGTCRTGRSLNEAITSRSNHVVCSSRYNILFLCVTYVVPLAVMAVCYTIMGRELWGSKTIGQMTQRHADSIKSKRKVSLTFAGRFRQRRQCVPRFCGNTDSRHGTRVLFHKKPTKHSVDCTYKTVRCGRGVRVETRPFPRCRVHLSSADNRSVDPSYNAIENQYDLRAKPVFAYNRRFIIIIIFQYPRKIIRNLQVRTTRQWFPTKP